MTMTMTRNRRRTSERPPRRSPLYDQNTRVRFEKTTAMCLNVSRQFSPFRRKWSADALPGLPFPSKIDHFRPHQPHEVQQNTGGRPFFLLRRSGKKFLPTTPPASHIIVPHH